MTCGRTRRVQFASQREYEQHRIAMLKHILGPNWQDMPLPELIAQHPELRTHTIYDLIARHELSAVSEPPIWRAEAVEVVRAQPQHPRSSDAPADAPRAIENGARQTAEDWLKEYLREHDGAEREN